MLYTVINETIKLNSSGTDWLMKNDGEFVAIEI